MNDSIRKLMPMSRKILVVGAGGLGCELLKLLVRDPESEITVIDIDTVDVTNLNRQFLFTRTNVGESKAVSAAHKLAKWQGEKGAGTRLASVLAINANVYEYKKISFYKQFCVVYTCLDSDEVRSFVNARCSFAGILMIDGGSGGWLGQSFCNLSECFDCLPKKRARTYAVCSIRSVPQKFEHCLAWAAAIVEENNVEGFVENYLEYTQACAPSSRPNATSWLRTSQEEQDEVSTLDDESLLLENPFVEAGTESANTETNANDLQTDKESFKRCKYNNIPPAQSDDHTSTSTLLEEGDAVRSGSSSIGDLADTVVPSSELLQTRSLRVMPSSLENLVELNSNSETESSDIKLIDHSSADVATTADKEDCVGECAYRSLDEFVAAIKGVDKDTHLSLIYQMALWKAKVFNIAPDSFLDSQTYLLNITPSICTTNAIVASLMVLSAITHLNYYLVQGRSGIISVQLNPPKESCSTCTSHRHRCLFRSEATIKRFFEVFPAHSLASGTQLFLPYDTAPLSVLDGEFAMTNKDGKLDRFYFEMDESLPASVFVQVDSVDVTKENRWL